MTRCPTHREMGEKREEETTATKHKLVEKSEGERQREREGRKQDDKENMGEFLVEREAELLWA